MFSTDSESERDGFGSQALSVAKTHAADRKRSTASTEPVTRHIYTPINSRPISGEPLRVKRANGKAAQGISLIGRP